MVSLAELRRHSKLAAQEAVGEFFMPLVVALLPLVLLIGFVKYVLSPTRRLKSQEAKSALEWLERFGIPFAVGASSISGFSIPPSMFHEVTIVKNISRFYISDELSDESAIRIVLAVTTPTFRAFMLLPFFSTIVDSVYLLQFGKRVIEYFESQKALAMTAPPPPLAGAHGAVTTIETDMDATKLNGMIDELEREVKSIVLSKARWKLIWDQIKAIGSSFKETRYPSKDEREKAWERFQSLVERVKSAQGQADQNRERVARISEQHKNEILKYAQNALPPNSLAEAVATVTFLPVYLLKAAVNALIPGPPVDETKESLQYCSRQLAEGWRLLSLYKDEMLGRDKKEAFEALNRSKEILDAAWAAWKGSNNKAYQERQEAHQAKREAWKSHVRGNIENLQGRRGKLLSVLAHKESHLEDLQEQRRSARSDEFRSRVEGWIEEEEEAIRDIRSKVTQLESWIDEERDKLA